tara:strand:- start:129 stop:410 length:282 start_codon:yes stop_codon:yes gene_type:complete
MSNTVTSQLRKSITKVTGQIVQERIYSDDRKNGQAVGVKLCYASFEENTKNAIVEDMESKGYKLAYVRFNQSRKEPGYFSTIPGTRFCFYKKC